MKTQRTTKEIEHLLLRMKKILKRIYGSRLVNVILYGSFARNKAQKESDIDIAVILKGRVNKSKEIDRIYDVLYALMLETGELISVYPLSDKEIDNSVWPLYYHVKMEGIKI